MSLTAIRSLVVLYVVWFLEMRDKRRFLKHKIPYKRIWAI